MRVLIAAYADRSLLLSLVPLAWALRAAGNEVTVATGPAAARAVVGAGLPAVPVGRADGLARTLASRAADHPARAPGLLSPYHAATGAVSWPDLVRGYEEQLTRWHKTVNVPMVEDLVTFATHWRPDLVVWEATTYAGAIAARSCGAAHARFVWSIDVFAETRRRFLNARADSEDTADPLGRWLSGYARSYGFDSGEDLVSGQVTIDQLPASLRMRAAGTYLSMQYVPYGTSGRVPGWLRRPTERPRVAVTFGLTAAQLFGGHHTDLDELLESLADLDIEVIATATEPQLARARRVPDNVHLTPPVPLDVLAQSCAAVIHHAGPGTMLTVARYGVPQLLLPWYFDEPELARRVEAQGAARTLPPGAASAAAVRAGVVEVLTESVIDAAQELRAEIGRMPTPGAVATQLSDLFPAPATPRRF